MVRQFVHKQEGTMGLASLHRKALDTYNSLSGDRVSGPSHFDKMFIR